MVLEGSDEEVLEGSDEEVEMLAKARSYTGLGKNLSKPLEKKNRMI